jgi:hypothetical protein
MPASDASSGMSVALVLLDEIKTSDRSGLVGHVIPFRAFGGQ